MSAPIKAIRALTIPDDGMDDADQFAEVLCMLRDWRSLKETRRLAQQQAHEDIADMLGSLTVNDRDDSSPGPLRLSQLTPSKTSSPMSEARATASRPVHAVSAKKSSSTTRKLATGKQMPPTSSSASQHNLDADTSLLAGSSSKLTAASAVTTNVAEADTENVFYASVPWNFITPESELSKWTKSAARDGAE
ncbi:hypothetical protein LTS10_010865 [Elasticomyces elasticus]|nr:hypothetical protein LTS10_010865 [Elasticomyces elasticus]